MQSRFFASSAVLLAVLVSFAPTADAGFEWRGDVPAAVETAPQGNGEDIIRWDPPAAAETAVTAPAAPVQPVEAAPAESVSAEEAAPEAEQPAVAEAVAPAAPVESAPILSGFGKDLPLPVALQQILPAGTQYSFSREVNPGQLVSWQGGKVWSDVLKDALAAVNLEFRQQGKIVAIGPLRAEQPVAAVSSEAAPAPVNDVVIPAAEPQNRAAQIPDDMLITSSPASAQPAPVSIRRERPKSTAPRADVDAAAPAAPENKSAADVAVADSAETLVIAPAAKPSMIVGESWQATRGDTLRDTLKKWSASAGVDLFWSTDFDYRVVRDSQYMGNFSEAVKSLLDQYAGVTPQPYGQLHQDGQNPKVLIIRAYDDNALRG